MDENRLTPLRCRSYLYIQRGAGIKGFSLVSPRNASQNLEYDRVGHSAIGKPDLQYLTDEGGNRTAVVLSMKKYQQMLHELEELASIRAYDAAKAVSDESIPFEQAIDEIERMRG